MGENYFGKFMLDKHQIKEFTKLYAEAVEYGVVFSIAENPKEYGPLLIDLDLEVPSENYYINRFYYKVFTMYISILIFLHYNCQ